MVIPILGNSSILGYILDNYYIKHFVIQKKKL